MTDHAQPSRNRQTQAAFGSGQRGVSSRDLLASMRRAVDFHLKGDYLGAETLLRGVLRVDPELPEAHHHLAVVLHAQHQFLDAERHLALAQALDPHLPGIADRLSQYRLDASGRAA